MGKFLYYFSVFFLYSVFGYICECIYCSIREKKIVTNRGFLLGPYLPIYGFGAILIVLLLNKYIDDALILFVMACVIATILEYITSYIMEKVFKARWWDYSEKRLNINGRVCLENSFLFGIGGLFMMYILNPFLLSIIDSINKSFLMIVSFIILVIFLLDFFISASTIYKLRQNSIIINKDKNLPRELNKELHRKLSKSKYFKKRMLNAFPNIKNIKGYNKINEIVKEKNKK